MLETVEQIINGKEKVAVQLLISKNNKVTKSNLLIDAAYNLTPLEFKLVQTVFSNVQPADQSTNTYTFPIKHFLEFLELKGKSGYHELKKMTLNLFKQPVSITIEGVTTQVTWFSLIKYNDNEGTITIEINKFWDKYLLSLDDGNFTSYKLFNISKLKSIYSLRIYELLSARVNFEKKFRTFTIGELREILGIEESMYPKYSNLKQRVILQAQKELKAESDIAFEFEEIKSGRSVHKIKFIISRNIPKQSMNRLIIDAVVLGEENSSLKEFGLKPKVINEITERYSIDQINRNIAYTKDKIRLNEVKSPAAYLKRAIENDYASSVTSKKERENNQEVMLENLLGKNEEVDKNLYDKTVEEFELHLLNVKNLKEELDTKEIDIHNELYRQLMNYQKYQENTYDKLISPMKFTHEYLQTLCKKVLSNIYK